MKSLTLFIAIFFAGLALATGLPSTLTLDRPSVVAVYTPDNEVTAAEKSSDGFADFIDDFWVYRQAIESALRGNKEVAFVNSSATRILFKGNEHTPITRSSLSGYGFVIYVPGQAPVIFRGVATDDDVLCELKQIDPHVKVSAQCGQTGIRTPLLTPKL
jgi:hypothetical protein